MHTFTDAEQRFADSPEGRRELAYERSKFEMRNAHLRDRAPKWDDEIQANAVRDLATATARTTIEHTAITAAAQREEPGARVAHDAEYAARKIAMRNAWREG